MFPHVFVIVRSSCICASSLISCCISCFSLLVNRVSFLLRALSILVVILIINMSVLLFSLIVSDDYLKANRSLHWNDASCSYVHTKGSTYVLKRVGNELPILKFYALYLSSPCGNAWQRGRWEALSRCVTLCCWYVCTYGQESNALVANWSSFVSSMLKIKKICWRLMNSSAIIIAFWCYVYWVCFAEMFSNHFLYVVMLISSDRYSC